MPAVCEAQVATSAQPTQQDGVPTPFHPPPLEEWSEVGLPETLLEALVTKYLFTVGEQTGRGVAAALCLPPKPVIDLLQTMKNHQLAFYKDKATMGDFTYCLSEAGRERARRMLEDSMYVGAAPVPLAYYVESVRAQSITVERPGPRELREAFSDILLSEHMVNRLGPAINSGRGLFLYGAPGNGKTTIAERITRCFGLDVWIPKSIYIEGEIVKFYDPQCHESVGGERTGLLRSSGHDLRWIKVRRPTIVVGGELVMSSLEMQYNPHTKITEPSVQLKSNCGTLVIDDFGRQRMSTDELLNRWIVPLEKRYDFLSLATGNKIQVPFDQLIIFSTNLEPRDLVDEAFLRRIPYKINVIDPTEDEYRELMRRMAARLNIPYEGEVVEDLLQRHYRAAGRPLRCCHPRDLLMQVVNNAAYQGVEPRMTAPAFEAAVENYFAIM